MENTKKDYDDLIKRSQKEPGLKELLELHGHYKKVLKKSNMYLKTRNIKPKTKTSSSTEC